MYSAEKRGERCNNKIKTEVHSQGFIKKLEKLCIITYTIFLKTKKIKE